jgi:outer membrane protein assembly factor BamD (BamD/ComL family)
MKHIRISLIALLALAVVAGGRAVDARKLWTPETGEVTLEEMPRETPEQQRRFAFALLGIGQWEEGVRILQEQIKQHPDAEWVPHTRYSMGRALLDADQSRRAFDVLDEVDAEQADDVLLQRVRDLQFQAARVRADESLRGALRMLDRMMKHMETDEKRAFVMKEKADVTRLAGRYLDAMGRYMEAIDAYPRSTWVPYCEYGLALCQWRFAQWLRLGLEDVTAAQRSFEDFVEVYPTHPLTPEAKEKLQEARRMRWEMLNGVADYYAQKENRPWAAARYLNFMVKELPEMEEEELQQARLKAGKHRGALPKPMPGDTWDLDTSNLVTSENQQ